MKHIILCADDYGQNTAISQAIIDLIQKNRLSAVSCMTHSYYWANHAKWLLPYKDQVDLGLHFNLTDGERTSSKISTLILKGFFHLLDQEQIEKEFQHQINDFVTVIGRLPDFIDGHQHIQHIPQIRKAILNVYEKKLRENNTYIRCVFNPHVFLHPKASGFLKACVVQLTGAYGFKKMLERRNIPHNSSFSGLYNFSDANKYADIFPGFLTEIKDKGIIMCHPGREAYDEEDRIAPSRALEYLYLQSDLFSQACDKNEIKLGRFRD